LPLDLLPAPHPAIFFLTLLFQDAATTAIYTLSLHDALPISPSGGRPCRRKSGGDGGSPATHTARTARHTAPRSAGTAAATPAAADRKSTRLNSSHVKISYAVFCLKKKSNGMKKRHYDN